MQNRVDGVARGVRFRPAVRRKHAAARTARVPHGRKTPLSTVGPLSPSCGFAAQRLRSARHLTAPPPRMPPCRRREVVAQSSLTLASPAVKGACFSLSTANLNRACLQASLRSAAGTAPAGRRSLRRYALVSGRQQENRKPADASQRVNAHCSALINLFLSRRI